MEYWQAELTALIVIDPRGGLISQSDMTSAITILAVMPDRQWKLTCMSAGIPTR